MRKNSRGKILLGLAIGGFLALIPLTRAAIAGPTVLVGITTSASERTPMEQISHDDWNTLLQKYVDRQGMVDYTRWKASPTDVALLDSYINHLSSARIGVASAQAARLAFWINAYNAVTVKGILREYPTTSIRNHTAKLWGYNIWKDLKLKVGGKQLSLDDMEHQILRKMGEPRIHFAIVCASIGCPPLRSEAYTAEKVDGQLTANAKSFFSDQTKFRYDRSRGRLFLSPILSWFATDFGANQVAQLKRIAPYVPEAAQPLAASGKASVSYLDYDWNLNDQKR